MMESAGMDLLGKGDEELYFDEPLPESIGQLIDQAAAEYHDPDAEFLLLAAYMILPHHLTVHVALYRYYYYKHRLPEALLIAQRTLEDSGALLGFSGQWHEVTLDQLMAGEPNMNMVRYYLLALKGSGLICLRMGRHEEGIMRLKKVSEMDVQDKLGARAIIEVVEREPELEEA